MEETGIPGHASKNPSMHRLQRLLGELGLNYEAEGDVVRIHYEGVVIELSDYGDEIQVQVELVPEHSDIVERDALMFYVFGLASSMLGVEEYGVDSVAGYSMLWASKRYSSLEEAVGELEELVRFLVEAVGRTRKCLLPG
ncbi:MAG: hypothetical protein GSR72_04560 [Desulfurococcales archaeon]|nr:hypothetical protein [Desulfurococcales archaeon]